MKRIFSAAVLFILLVLTMVALTRVDAPRTNTGTTTEANHPIFQANTQR